ncbi:PAS domain-containing sensor histidine kinase [Arcobacter sp.]|uniref:PAS domain-containing sensor histidine kinase n=1 Tax=unclassified Arcobacter TaxID=2593671 RepID=UPI003B008DB4
MSQTYQEAIENSNIVSKTDINGIITFVNDEFCKISGYKYEELIGSNHNIVRHPNIPKSNFTLLWDTILNKKPYKATVKNLTKDGKTVYLNTTITPILDENDEIKEFIAIRYDVTEEVELKKRLEKKEIELEELNKDLENRVFYKTKELKELNKTLEHRVKEEIIKNEEKQKLLFLQSRMASLGQMLGNIAHQWRQPLTELNLTLFNMKKFFNTNEKEKLDELYIESKNLISSMSSTIDDFSNFFNPQKDKKSFEIKKAVDEAILILKKVIKDINLNIDVPLNYQVLGVLNELTQVIINLIQNSKDAFILNHTDKKIIQIKLSEEKFLGKKYAKLEIIDNAGGISKDNLDKIFDPYFTTKHKSQGTGLGLFMSKMIIEKSLEGELIHKNFENGSNFTIFIPLNN